MFMIYIYSIYHFIQKLDISGVYILKGLAKLTKNGLNLIQMTEKTILGIYIYINVF